MYIYIYKLCVCVCVYIYIYIYISGSSAGKECKRPRFDSWVRKLPWIRDKLPVPVFLGFPGGSNSKEFPATWENWV